MRPIHSLPILLTTLAASLFSAGCADQPNAVFQEPVNFNSTPAKAIVSLDGNAIGPTPTQAVLSREHDTHITIAKPGFVTADLYVHGTGGHLQPNPVSVALKTELLPEKPGPNPAAELAACLENLKKYVAIGTISADDEPYVEQQIRAFYK